MPVSAFAGEATYELPQPVVVGKSRAEVRAEVLQARRDGTLVVTEGDVLRQPAFVASRSRAAVVDEVRADAGASHALAAEPHGFDAPWVRRTTKGLIASAAR